MSRTKAELKIRPWHVGLYFTKNILANEQVHFPAANLCAIGRFAGVKSIIFVPSL